MTRKRYPDTLYVTADGTGNRVYYDAVTSPIRTVTGGMGGDPPKRIAIYKLAGTAEIIADVRLTKVKRQSVSRKVSARRR